MRKMPGQPDSAPSSCLSQSSVLAKRLFTTRTTQTPPARASTLNSVAIGGEPGAQPSASLVNNRGGSQAVTTERDSMPGPKVNFAATGFPSTSSNSAGQNQHEIPGPVAMACQTSSGVPGTSTSTWMERRPEASFFTLMMLAPLLWLPRVWDTPRSSSNVDAPRCTRRFLSLYVWGLHADAATLALQHDPPVRADRPHVALLIIHLGYRDGLA